MKIENKLTLAHLKQNKRRTIITIIGIALSVAMFTVVICCGASFLDLMERSAIVENGNYHFYVNSSSDKIINALESRDDIEDFCFEYRTKNEERGYYIEQGLNKRTSIGDWICGDSKYLSWMINNNYQGQLPSAENEIIIGDKLINENNLDWKIGDTVEISTIERYLGFGDVVIMLASGPFKHGEQYKFKYKDSYKIVGIIENSNKIYRFADNNRKNANTYVRFKNITPLTVSNINKLFKEIGINPKKDIGSAGINETLMMANLSFEEDSTTAIGIVAIVGLILLVIMAFAVVMIYNAFSMSYAEKVRYLGMLSSVGATRKQKLKSSYFEALVLGSAGIGLGFVVGLGITEIAILTIGKSVIEAGFVSGADMFRFKLVAPIWALALILALSVITILLSVYKPALKSSFITPIDAIRQSNEYNVKKTRNPWIVKKLFGYEGVLSYKNQRRNGRKGKIITASIAFSIVMIMVCNYACDIGMQAADISDEVPYQVTLDYSAADMEELNQLLDKMPDVDNYYSVKAYYLSQDFEPFDNIRQNLDAINKETLTEKYQGLLDSNVMYDFYAIDDDEFDAYCIKNGIDPKPFYELDDTKIKCVVMNNISHKKNGLPVFTDKLLGQEVYEYTVADGDYTEEEAELINISWYSHFQFEAFGEYDEDNRICHLSRANTVSCFYPLSADIAYQKYVHDYYRELEDEHYEEDDYFNVYYGIETKNHKRVTEEIQFFLDAKYDELENANGPTGFDGGGVYDIEEQLAIMKTTVTVAKVLLYGFILLIIMIIMFNIINIISTSTELRKKEFAMLKSVGTSPKGFKKMIALESIFYDIRALIIAIPISVGICYTLNVVLGDGKIPFIFNIPLCIIASVVSFAVVIISMLLGLKNTNENSIIEDLKND